MNGERGERAPNMQMGTDGFLDKTLPAERARRGVSLQACRFEGPDTRSHSENTSLSARNGGILGGAFRYHPTSC